MTAAGLALFLVFICLSHTLKAVIPGPFRDNLDFSNENHFESYPTNADGLPTYNALPDVDVTVTRRGYFFESSPQTSKIFCLPEFLIRDVLSYNESYKLDRSCKFFFNRRYFLAYPKRYFCLTGHFRLEAIQEAFVRPMRSVVMNIHTQAGLDIAAPYLTNVGSLCLKRLYGFCGFNPVNSENYFDISNLPANPYLEVLKISYASPNLDFYELAAKFPNLRTLIVWLRTDASEFFETELEEQKQFQISTGEIRDISRLNKKIDEQLEHSIREEAEGSVKFLTPSPPLNISGAFCADLGFLNGLPRLNYLELCFPIRAETINIDCLSIPPLKGLKLAIDGELSMPDLPDIDYKEFIPWIGEPW